MQDIVIRLNCREVRRPLGWAIAAFAAATVFGGLLSLVIGSFDYLAGVWVAMLCILAFIGNFSGVSLLGKTIFGGREWDTGGNATFCVTFTATLLAGAFSSILGNEAFGLSGWPLVLGFIMPAIVLSPYVAMGLISGIYYTCMGMARFVNWFTDVGCPHDNNR